MPLYLADKKATLFKGEHKPVSLYLGDKKVTGYEYAEQTGEYLTFENTYNDTASVVINGKSEQVQTVQGKNLLDPDKIMTGYDSYGRDIYSTRVITEDNYTLYQSFLLKVKPETRYQVSKENLSTRFRGFFFAKNPIENPSEISIGGQYMDASSTVLYATAPANANWFFVVLTNNKDTHPTGWVQVEEGTTATPYEPFVPNSPSPDYPSPIKSVGDNGGFDLVSAGNNLFDVESALAYFPNIEYDSDIGITLSKSDGLSWGNKPVFITLPAGMYYFSTTGNKARLQIQDENSRPIATNVITPTSISLNRTTGLKIKILTETSIYPWVIGNFQISATATPYTPFRGMQTVHIPYTLRSLPDGTCDYIEVDNVSRKAFYHQLIGVTSVNGEEAMRQYTYNNLRGVSILDFLPYRDTRASGVCTHENRVGEYYDISGTYMWLGVGTTVLHWIGILDYLGFDDVSEFAQWATAQHSAGTPVTVQYKLANPPEPIELDYTAVRTYYPYTQIYTTATVQPTLEAKIRVWEGNY